MSRVVEEVFKTLSTFFSKSRATEVFELIKSWLFWQIHNHQKPVLYFSGVWNCIINCYIIFQNCKKYFSAYVISNNNSSLKDPNWLDQLINMVKLSVVNLSC